MVSKIDLTGQRFGRLEIIQIAPAKNKRVAWLCRCDCGKECIVTTHDLRKRDCPIRSCGCLRSDTSKKRLKDRTGQRQGALLIIERDETRIQGTYWVCRCDCGKLLSVSASNLSAGQKSCGCKAREESSLRMSQKITHGQTHTRLYRLWVGMRQRCFDENASNYGRYGGRGITVCDEWDRFENFRDWSLKNGYSDELTIDRIDYDGHYGPDNCRWVSDKIQANNRSTNHYLEYDGQIMSIADWARKKDINPNTLANRIRRGWPIEKALTKKPSKIKRNHHYKPAN